MKTKVFHQKQPTFGMTTQLFPDDYELVAELDEECTLEAAFRYTNTIDCPWWDYEGVLGMIVHKRTRSTSVGDVVEVAGKAYLCENAGWSPVVPK